MILETIDLWTKLACARWMSIPLNCWIVLSPMFRLWLSLLLSDVSRGDRENTLWALFSLVTVMTSCWSFWLAEVSLISTNSSVFSPRNRHIWCHCCWRMEVRHIFVSQSHPSFYSKITWHFVCQKWLRSRSVHYGIVRWDQCSVSAMKQFLQHIGYNSHFFILSINLVSSRYTVQYIEDCEYKQ